MVIYKPKYYEPIIIENNKIVPMYENVINFSEPRMSKKPLQNWRGLTKNQVGTQKRPNPYNAFRCRPTDYQY